MTTTATAAASRNTGTDLYAELKKQYATEVSQLKELFDGWKEEDLLSTLQEAHGDLELAIARITEGHAFRWTENKTKKGKGQRAQASAVASGKGPNGPTGDHKKSDNRSYNPRDAKRRVNGPDEGKTGSKSETEVVPASEKHAHEGLEAKERSATWKERGSRPPRESDRADRGFGSRGRGRGGSFNGRPRNGRPALPTEQTVTNGKAHAGEDSGYRRPRGGQSGSQQHSGSYSGASNRSGRPQVQQSTSKAVEVEEKTSNSNSLFSTSDFPPSKPGRDVAPANVSTKPAPSSGSKPSWADIVKPPKPLAPSVQEPTPQASDTTEPSGEAQTIAIASVDQHRSTMDQRPQAESEGPRDVASSATDSPGKYVDTNVASSDDSSPALTVSGSEDTVQQRGEDPANKKNSKLGERQDSKLESSPQFRSETSRSPAQGKESQYATRALDFSSERGAESAASSHDRASRKGSSPLQTSQNKRGVSSGRSRQLREADGGVVMPAHLGFSGVGVKFGSLSLGQETEERSPLSALKSLNVSGRSMLDSATQASTAKEAQTQVQSEIDIDLKAPGSPTAQQQTQQSQRLSHAMAFANQAQQTQAAQGQQTSAVSACGSLNQGSVHHAALQQSQRQPFQGQLQSLANQTQALSMHSHPGGIQQQLQQIPQQPSIPQHDSQDLQQSTATQSGLSTPQQYLSNSSSMSALLPENVTQPSAYSAYQYSLGATSTAQSSGHGVGAPPASAVPSQGYMYANTPVANQRGPLGYYDPAYGQMSLQADRDSKQGLFQDISNSSFDTTSPVDPHSSGQQGVQHFGHHQLNQTGGTQHQAPQSMPGFAAAAAAAQAAAAAHQMPTNQQSAASAAHHSQYGPAVSYYYPMYWPGQFPAAAFNSSAQYAAQSYMGKNMYPAMYHQHGKGQPTATTTAPQAASNTAQSGFNPNQYEDVSDYAKMNLQHQQSATQAQQVQSAHALAAAQQAQSQQQQAQAAQQGQQLQQEPHSLHNILGITGSGTSSHGFSHQQLAGMNNPIMTSQAMMNMKSGSVSGGNLPESGSKNYGDDSTSGGKSRGFGSNASAALASAGFGASVGGGPVGLGTNQGGKAPGSMYPHQQQHHNHPQSHQHPQQQPQHQQMGYGYNPMMYHQQQQHQYSLHQQQVAPTSSAGGAGGLHGHSNTQQAPTNQGGREYSYHQRANWVSQN